LNTAWARFSGALAALAVAALVAWPLAGAEWALGLVAAGLLLMVLHHARNLAAFLRWLEAPRRETMPIGSGAWETALAELHRHFKSRDESEHEVAVALARFRAAGQALPDGVVILNRERQIEWANPTAERHLDIDTRNDAGQAITNLVRNPDFLAYLGSGAYGEPLVLRRARGEASVLTLRVIDFGDDQKLLLTRDITMEEKLDTMRRDFVANVSHELKTPVTVLSGFVETLSDEAMALSAEQKKKFLGLMSEQARRMQRLIEDLLTLSTLESSNAPPDDQAIDVRPLVEKLAEEARMLSGGRHKVQVSVQTDARLTGSAREVSSALSNLVSNAVRYTPDGGVIRIDWQLRDGQGVFSVEDSGIGIEQRHIARLTERFYRVDNSRSRESGGTGLGLAIVKHVLTRHQASLEIRSEFGRGSTFSAVFPARRVEKPDTARAA
jgi:two-component system, OmpR family, phosphate regulon sensor histidine kinase PhoR